MAKLINLLVVVYLVFNFGLSASPNTELQGRQIRWSPKSRPGNFHFARMLMRAKDKIPGYVITNIDEDVLATNVVCDATVVRPQIGMDAFSDPLNYMYCKLDLVNGDEGFLYFDLSSVPIHRFGNQFFPKGFTISGPVAQAFFDTLQEIYLENPDDPFLSYSDVHVEDAARSYDFVDYAIPLTEKDPSGERTGPHSIMCSQDFIYPKDQNRPAKAQSLQCQFIYQWEYDGSIW